ncbi:MAG: helix-turn-helix domain-containing protein [Leadbetterella sp.]
MRIVNQNIRFFRKRLRLTQEKFSIEVGVKRASIGSYEEDRAIPPADVLSRIAQVCGVSVDDLIHTRFEKQRQEIIEERFVARRPIVQEVPLPIKEEVPQVQNTTPTLFDLPLFQQIEEPRRAEPIEPIQTPVREKKVSVPYQKDTIPYVNRASIKRFLKETDLDTFGSILPFVQFPFTTPSVFTWAFDAPEDFPLSDTVLIAELISNFSQIKDGENHLLFFKNGSYSYRRVYNQMKIKGVLLTNSDKTGVTSEEYDVNSVQYVFKPLAFISMDMPKPEAEVGAIKNKINELTNLISKL